MTTLLLQEYLWRICRRTAKNPWKLGRNDEASMAAAGAADQPFVDYAQLAAPLTSKAATVMCLQDPVVGEERDWQRKFRRAADILGTTPEDARWQAACARNRCSSASLHHTLVTIAATAPLF